MGSTVSDKLGWKLLGFLFDGVGVSVSETPGDLAGGHTVSVDQARQLWEDDEAVFVDVRRVRSFCSGHIPTAVSAAYANHSRDEPGFNGQGDQFDLGQLPRDKDQPVVIYGYACFDWRAYKAAVAVIAQGYSQVSYLRLGWRGWCAQGLPGERSVVVGMDAVGDADDADSLPRSHA